MNDLFQFPGKFQSLNLYRNETSLMGQKLIKKSLLYCYLAASNILTRDQTISL